MATLPAIPNRASKRMIFFSWEITDQSSHFSRSSKKMLTRSALSNALVSIVINSKREITSPTEVIRLQTLRIARSRSACLPSPSEDGISRVGVFIGFSLTQRRKHCQRRRRIDNNVHVQQIAAIIGSLTVT